VPSASCFDKRVSPFEGNLFMNEPEENEFCVSRDIAWLDRSTEVERKKECSFT
jgi:hypothetical protein